MQNLALTVAAAAFLAPIGLAQFSLVAPNGYNALEGNSNNAFPWNRGASSIQVQCIYDSTNFTLQGVSSPILISQVKFRADATTASWTGGTYGQLQIDVSTCPVDFAAASSTFASNHGADRTTVQNGPFTILPGTGNGTGVPGPYHVVVPFSAPFVYDPTTGNDLCIDIMVDGSTWGGGTLVQCDNVSGATAVPPPLGTRVYNTSGFNLPTGTVGTHYTAVCEFTYVPATGLWPAFTATPTTGASPLAVQFTDQTFTSDPGGVLAWQWDFDGDSVIDSTLQNPSFTYVNCGSYNVTLTAIDGTHGPVTVTRNNYINTDAVVADFFATLIAPGTMVFTDTSTPTPTAWAWDLDGDSVIDSTAQNPAFVYPTTNTYNVTLTASRLCGAPSTVTRPVTPALTLTTLYAGGNGGASGWGVFFDVNVTNPTGIVLTNFDVNVSSTTAFTLDVYLTPGSYVGLEATLAPWRLVGQASGTGLGTGLPSPAALAQPIFLAAGSYGMVLYYNGASPSYTNGTGSNQSYSNGDLALSLGASRSVFLSTTGGSFFTPRVWNGTIVYDKLGFGNLAGYGFFAPGCSGSAGISNIDNAGVPALGRSMTLTVNNLPLNVAVMMLGFSRTTSAFGPLPLDLGFLGAPGCLARVSNTGNFTVFGSGGAATWTLPIPNTPNLIGIQFYNQAVVLDPTANSLGAVLSDAAAATVGS